MLASCELRCAGCKRRCCSSLAAAASADLSTRMLAYKTLPQNLAPQCCVSLALRTRCAGHHHPSVPAAALHRDAQSAGVAHAAAVLHPAPPGASRAAPPPAAPAAQRLPRTQPCEPSRRRQQGRQQQARWYARGRWTCGGSWRAASGRGAGSRQRARPLAAWPGPAAPRLPAGASRRRAAGGNVVLRGSHTGAKLRSVGGGPCRG